MRPEVLYLGVYVSVLNEKIYDESYLEMLNFIKEEGFSDEVHGQILKILGDDNEKIPLDKVLETLKSVSEEEKDMAIMLALHVAFSDNYYSVEEEKFFKNVCLKIDYSEERFAEMLNDAKALSDNEIQKTVKPSKKLHGKVFYSLLSKITSGNLQALLQERYSKCLLSGTDYSDAIKSMRQISNEDIVFAKEALDNIAGKMDTFLNNLKESTSAISRIKKKITKEDDDDKVKACLDGIKKQVSDFINETKDRMEVSLKEKEIASKYYTISFMGRTKSGKSTLHSVILGGENKEFIGVGKERTTRLNRIYNWNGIRIIDTPGIGAPDGKTDTEIARSVVEGSDLICYLVTSDSIQETEFAFLKELKEQNKPLVILLNKKENLMHPVHRKKFLENPLQWFERKDNDSLEGHFKRIKEYAEKYYSNSYFDIYPVQLLAAQMAQTESNSKDKKKFYRGSRIQYFLDNLRIQILDNGKIKRSQTMLNGTIYSLGRYRNVFDEQLKELEAIKKTLSEQSSKAIADIKKARKEVSESLENGLKSIFESFIQNDIREFANENYDIKDEDVLQHRWNSFFKESGFEKSLQNRIEKENENYRKKVEEVIKSFSETLTFAFETLDMKFDISSTFDTKKLLAIGSGLVGLAAAVCLVIPGFQIAGLVLGALALLGSFISGLFSSKASKIREAQEKLYSSLRDSFGNQKSTNIKKIMGDFGDVTGKVEKSVIRMFQIMNDELEKLINELKPLCEMTGVYEDKLNKIYALRMMNFCGKDFNVNDKSLYNKIKVHHDFGKKIEIKTDLISWVNTSKLKLILQEDVVFKKFNK